MCMTPLNMVRFSAFLLLLGYSGLIWCQSGEVQVECYTDAACSDATPQMTVNDCCFVARATWFKEGTDGECKPCIDVILFSFGQNVGDDLVPMEDDGSSPLIVLREPFNIFQEKESDLFVNANGILSFRVPYDRSSSQRFDSSFLPSVPLVAPFWDDVDITRFGKIFYRQTDDPVSLQRAADLIRELFLTPHSIFYPTILFIATWDRVAQFDGSDTMTGEENTFQVVLATNGNKTFVLFIYHTIEWYRVSSSSIGFKNENGNRHLTVSTSQPTTSSNVGLPGVYIYRIDGTECPDGQVTCPFNQSECIPSQFLCDGTVNCYDESDESPLFCPCPAGHARCRESLNECVSVDQFCDGQCDCSDGSDEASMCDEVIECDPLLPPAKGMVQVPPARTPGSIATFNCKFGFSLVGEENITCEENGKWSSNVPTCQIHFGIPIAASAIVILFLILTIIIVVLCSKCHKRRLKKMRTWNVRITSDRNTAIYHDSLNQGNNSTFYLGKAAATGDSESDLLGRFRVRSFNRVQSEFQDDLVIHSTNLKILETVGQGEFGVVYKGNLLKDLGQTVVGTVAVKTLKGFLDDTLVNSLVEECLKMQQFDHPNVLKLLGVCLDGGPTPYLVMPFMSNGSLLVYLQKERRNLVISNSDTGSEEITSIALKRLTDMCLQVAKGMEYLTSKKYIHRDLAARNCMIDDNFVIKVADFGLSEQLNSKDYFRQDRETSIKLPVKWLAPESLADYIFSEKSDVWAYGVTCWEVFSGGKAPYASVNPHELSSLLEKGYRMEKPANEACSDHMFSIIKNCWIHAPSDRPTFSDLVEVLSKYLETMAGYLHIEAFTQQSLKFEGCRQYEDFQPNEAGSNSGYIRAN